MCLTANRVFGQNYPVITSEHPIYQCELRLMRADVSALFDIAPYFDSKTQVTEFLGHHILYKTESEIAHRVVFENTLFLENEFVISESSNTNEFNTFLNQHIDQIFFSELAASFMITPLEDRPVNFELRAVSEYKKQLLHENENMLLSADWVKDAKIDSLIHHHNPLALLSIASEYYKMRHRYNRYSFNDEEFNDLLQLLTGAEIGVEDASRDIHYPMLHNNDSEYKLNLLIYFSKYYTQFLWDEEQNIFRNPAHKITSLDKEAFLFQQIILGNDSIALDAFTQLTVCDPVMVTELADLYDNIFFSRPLTIPIFPFKFLKQLVLLTDYCKVNNIDFTGSADLQNDITLLQSRLPFNERRNLENKLINSLTLETVTAFEYWSLIHESSWNLTYSAGRILDVFYSKNWNNLITNDYYLKCYLKKAALFNNLGIIGSCNNYLKKFSGASVATLQHIKNLQTDDDNILSQIVELHFMDLEIKPFNRQFIQLFIYRKQEDCGVNNFEAKMQDLIANNTDQVKTEYAVSELLSQICYNQIATAIKSIENYSFRYAWQKYSFLESDFGFFILGDLNDPSTRNEFLELYAKFSEYELYAYYLDLAGIDYMTNKQLDYDKIYELLKYNSVMAFAGGGGGRQDNEVYALIKLLELTFNTTRGYPNKLCASSNMFYCDTDEMAHAWMDYLVDKKLLKLPHNEPISFHHK